MYIDTHTHLHHKFFNKDRADLICRMKKCGVMKYLEIPIGFESNFVMREKLKEFPGAKFAVGVHPTRLWKNQNSDIWMKYFREFAGMEDTPAIGEVGLDHHIPGTEKMWAIQSEWFHRFIDLADEFDKPLVLHIREAEEEAVGILRKHGSYHKGVVHCFTGDYELARQYMEMGLHLGIGGIVSRDCPELKEAVRKIPLSSIVLETDCPFLAPEPLRGRNTPENIPAIAGIIAELKDIDVNTVETVTTRNAEILFGI